MDSKIMHTFGLLVCVNFLTLLLQGYLYNLLDMFKACFVNAYFQIVVHSVQMYVRALSDKFSKIFAVMKSPPRYGNQDMEISITPQVPFIPLQSLFSHSHKFSTASKLISIIGFAFKRAPMCVLNCVQVFCYPMDCSIPGSSVHGIILARVLEWVHFLLPEIFLTRG